MEQKPNEQREMEQRAAELERKIVRFTNIDTESFTHSFRGVSITIKAGISEILRLPEANHLATHLARKILAREKKRTLKRSQGVQLWTDKEVEDYKKQILTPVGEEEAPERLSPEEARKADQERIKKDFGPAPTLSTPETAPEVTKKDVIKDLESRGIKVDPKKTKEELLEELLEAESKGITADNPQQ